MSANNPFYNEPVENIIKRRISVRTYSGKPLSTENRKRIMEYSKGLKGPFDVRTRFETLDMAQAREANGLKLGTYGMINGAATFVAAAVEKKEHAMEELGYEFEDLVLYITSLGLGTCWLAGTFNKSSFSKALDIKGDEFLPIVSPVGEPGNTRSIIDFLIKPDRTAKKRMGWENLFFRDDLKTLLGKAEAAAYSLPLEMVRLAPSASNKQPWRILSSNGNFHFYVCHSPAYAKAYPYDIQKIDMGIAMFHFDSTAREAGLKGKWDFVKPEVSDLPNNYEYIATWVSLQSAA